MGECVCGPSGLVMVRRLRSCKALLVVGTRSRVGVVGRFGAVLDTWGPACEAAGSVGDGVLTGGLLIAMGGWLVGVLHLPGVVVPLVAVCPWDVASVWWPSCTAGVVACSG